MPIERWKKLAGKEELFFLFMPAFNGSQEFVQEVNQLGLVAGYRCQFLTALPSLWDFRTAADEKVQWVVEKIGSELPVIIGPFAKDKVTHCKPKDILIDGKRSIKDSVVNQMSFISLFFSQVASARSRCN